MCNDAQRGMECHPWEPVAVRTEGTFGCDIRLSAEIQNQGHADLECCTQALPQVVVHWVDEYSVGLGHPLVVDCISPQSFELPFSSSSYLHCIVFRCLRLGEFWGWNTNCSVYRYVSKQKLTRRTAGHLDKWSIDILKIGNMGKKRKQTDTEERNDPQPSQKEQAVGDAHAFKNKEKVLILSTRGITFRCVCRQKGEHTAGATGYQSTQDAGVHMLFASFVHSITPRLSYVKHTIRWVATPACHASTLHIQRHKLLIIMHAKHTGIGTS
eukprot:1159282-Pelagomonas_calceolata.AAC.9